MQFNKDNTSENKNIFDYDYKVVDDVMNNIYTAKKQETPFKGPFVITQCFTNETVNLQYDMTKKRYNIH